MGRNIVDALALTLVTALFAAVSLWAFAWNFPADGAPAPLPRPAPPTVTVERLAPKHLVGHWTMIWGGGEWEVILGGNGVYQARRGRHLHWTGSWHLEADGTVSVAEAWLDEDGNRGCELRWSMVWKKDERGRFDPTHLSGKVRWPDGRSSSTTVTLKKEK